KMAEAGFAFHEYIVGSPKERIRHSTTEINDGRQSFGILNTLSFIQEGRQGKTIDEDLKRRTLSQLTAIEALLVYCNAHAQEIIDLVSTERARLPGMGGTKFALRMEHVHAGGTLRIPVVRLDDGGDTVMSVDPYHDVVRPVCSTTVPAGYCIPASQRTIIDVLKWHHVEMETVQTERSMKAETWWIDSVGADVLEEDSLPRPFVRKTREVVTVHPGDVLVSTRQWHGVFLPTMLEPESMWGLTKYVQFADLLKSKRYPIYRIP
ncbi:MAG: putative carboxypeptidase, partial [Bacteroidetes bacterium]|nr:putative carboxypeptidase [Bacteroidota bacterium]